MTAGGGSGVGGAVRRMAAAVVARELPAPPRALRRGPLRAVTWPHGVHEPRTALLLGRAAGTALAICFVTGIVSHLHQHPPAWLDVPSRPVWGYRFTQGVHVATGIAAVPLVLVKLWVVYPRLFTWPPLRTVGHALERLLLVPLVAGVLFELTTGLLNIVQWYPWGFAFTATHSQETNTLPSAYSYMSGRYPPAPPRKPGKFALADTTHTLAEAFREAGFRTALFSENPYLNPRTGFDQGFEKFELLHVVSCKAAVKAGDRLSPEEITALIEQRNLVQDAHHCPHGRPAALVFTREELDRKFKRI